MHCSLLTFFSLVWFDLVFLLSCPPYHHILGQTSISTILVEPYLQPHSPRWLTVAHIVLGNDSLALGFLLLLCLGPIGLLK